MSNLDQLHQDAAEFNAKYPVGTPVTYTPFLGKPEWVATKTRSEASVLRGHTVVVYLEGVCGAVATRHVTPETL